MKQAIAGFLLFAASTGAFAQSIAQPTLARIKVGSAIVRAAPGDQSPETGRLEAGATVTVVGAEGNDWLAIQPPSDSISWVPWTLVEPQKKPGQDTLTPPFLGVISVDQNATAPIRAGKFGDAKPLAVQRTRLPSGSIVKIIGPKVKLSESDGESSWYPILAPGDDYRFVRREAVEWTGTPVQASFVVKEGNSQAKPLPGSPATPGLTPNTGDFTVSIGGTSNYQKPSKGNWDPNYHPVYKEAEKARGRGDHAAAEKLYRQVAEEVAPAGTKQDIDLANLCYDRIFLLKSNSTVSGSSGTAEPRPSLKAEGKPEKKAYEGDGVLRETRYEIRGKAVYALVDRGGAVRHYAISGGVDLERYLGKQVTLVGEASYPDELRGDPLLVATQVKAAR